ncbi:MAG: diadenylate cyclase CdaA [Anaerolineae bacterium]
MSEVWQTFRSYFDWTISNLTPLSVVDILLVAAIFYGLLYLIRGTQAVQLLRGVLLLVLIVVLLTNVFQLTAFNWLIKSSLSALLVAIPVIFQPELRRALERLGRAGVLITRPSSEATATRVITHVSRAAKELSERRHGALIVLEQDTGLQDIVDTGIEVDAMVSSDLLQTIFFPQTALHDGAVIIREDRVVAAACVLPLAENPPSDRYLGTRHLAAIGITEQTDAIAIVVSEETGTISIAHNGRMIRKLDEGRLARILHTLYKPRFGERFPRWLRRESSSESTPSLLAE